jgi:hypothetical protein
MLTAPAVLTLALRAGYVLGDADPWLSIRRMYDAEHLGADVFDSSTPTSTHLLGNIIGQTPLVEKSFLGDADTWLSMDNAEHLGADVFDFHCSQIPLVASFFLMATCPD